MRPEQELLDYAVFVAVNAHSGQPDKGGNPYILHPLWVMFAFPAADVDARIVAVLHDVVEDTDVLLNDLRTWLPKYLVEAVDAITKREGELNRAYWTRCKANPIARRVKLVDMAHNSSPERLACLSPKEAEYLRNKYKEAVAFFGE